jgi:hypothetical protein
MTEALALTQTDISKLKMRAPTRIIDKLIARGEFVIVNDEQMVNHNETNNKIV